MSPYALVGAMTPNGTSGAVCLPTPLGGRRPPPTTPPKRPQMLAKRSTRNRQGDDDKLRRINRQNASRLHRLVATEVGQPLVQQGSPRREDRIASGHQAGQSRGGVNTL